MNQRAVRAAIALSAVATMIAATGSAVAAAPETVPPPGPAADGRLWPYGEFWNVPQLGEEPVRGSGCGGSGQIGESIPDGLWAGFVFYDGLGVHVDLLCVFAGEDAVWAREEPTAHVINDEPDYLIVNNNSYIRSLPRAENIHFRNFQVDPNGRCVEAFEFDAATHADQFGPSERQAWVRVHNGEAAWVVWGCTEFDTATARDVPSIAPAPPPTTPPPPAGVNERIEFAPGTAAATREGGVVRGTVNRYTLRAAAGQAMTADLSSVEDNAVFRVYAPDGRSLTPAEGATTWTAKLPADGDYVVEIASTRGNATYTLTVTITWPPTSDAVCPSYRFNEQYPLRLCDQSAGVWALQDSLRLLGYDLDADGYFGPHTETVVRQFQGDHGLAVDGLVGPLTWGRLMSRAPQPGVDADNSGNVDPWELFFD